MHEAAALTPRRVGRLVGRCWAIQLKSLTRSGFFILVTILQPIIFASIAFFMFRAGGRAPTLLYAALGAGLMGIWSATLFGSGGIIQWERWQGTLELLVAAPAPFVLVLLPFTLATSSLGMYSIGATLLWGKLFFGIPLELENPLLFVVAIPVTVLGLGLLGLVLASTFILYRNANALRTFSSTRCGWPRVCWFRSHCCPTGSIRSPMRSPPRGASERSGSLHWVGIPCLRSP